MPEEGLKKKTANGVLWSGVERFSSQGIGFALGILIARQLSPHDYGTIALLTIFFSICRTFVDSGFSSALIRKAGRTESDNSTVFYFSIFIGFIASLLLFLSAPLIAGFFEIPQLIPITRILSTTIFIGSFGSVQQALLTSRIDFKKQAKISLSTTIVTGIIGVCGAYSGLGVWALVIQMMSASILRQVLLWLFVKWRPTMPFSKQSFKELFSFGSKLLASALLDITYNNVYTLVIGKVFSASSLGNYSRASQYAQFPSSNITSIIQRVTFPVLSTIQDEDERLSLNYRRLLRMSAFIVFPLMVGLAAVSKPLILLFLTEKWIGAVTFLQIICFALMWYPIHAINLNLLQVKGRSDLFLKLEIIKKCIGVSILCVTIPMGLIPMCYGQIASSLICLTVNTYYTGKLIHVGYLRQMRDILPILFASLLMGALVYYFLMLFSSSLTQLIAGFLIGIASYTLITCILGFKEITYIKELVKRK